MSASITLGSFVFGPGTDTYIPQYGFDETHVKKAPTAPGWFSSTVTLSGKFSAATHIDIMTAYNAIKAAVHQRQQTLLIVDGPTIFNRDVYIESHNIPAEWNTKFADFEIVCSFVTPDVVTSGFLCSFDGFAFSPMPTIGQNYSYLRDDPRGDIKMVEMELVINGFFKEASFDLNLAKILAARDALKVKSGVFLYRETSGGINVTAFTSAGGLQASEQFLEDVADYSASFITYIPSASFPANIIEEHVRITDRPVFDQFDIFRSPGDLTRIVVNTGLTDIKRNISGLVDADTFVNAIARIDAIILANKPAGGILDGQPTLNYQVGGARVDFSYDFSDNT